MRKAFRILALLLLAALLIAYFALPAVIDSRINPVTAKPPYAITPAAHDLHKRLFVADLHADTLLWSRDPLAAASRGQLDLPRMQQGNIALQVFSTVTKVPRGQNFWRNESDSDDLITALALVQHWPVRTWGSLLERALYQGQRLHAAAEESGGQLRVVRTRAELAAFIKSRQPGQVAGVLATEGLQPLEGKLENIDKLFDAGFRTAGLAHFFDNEVGGSAHGAHRGGLTPFGREVVRRMEDRKMIVDLAHASPQVIDDVLAMARRPVLVSHTGVQAACRGPRNLSDDHVRRIAANGGLIGIGFFEGAVCGRDALAVAFSIAHVAHIAGIRHVALGSDFDGATRTAFDASGMALVTQALMDKGFSEADIAAVMGGNVQRFLMETLP
jgi:membrane dipeptidase